MPVAEIIAIGTELLLGDIQDTNTRYLARKLRDAGIDLYRATIIGDNAIRISQAIQEALERSEIVITSGGLGPTIDDPTRQAVAMAIGVDAEYRPELWEQIQERFSRYGREATENNRRQAFIPAGAQAIENPVGTAPAFLIETGDSVIVSLPGVPRELENLLEQVVLPFLVQKYDLKATIHEKIFHLAGVGESQVDEWIGDMETWKNPTIGLLAHPGQVDIRVAAKAETLDEAALLIENAAGLLKERLGSHLYGVDEETLESVVFQTLEQASLKLSLLECGLGGSLFARVAGWVTTAEAEIHRPMCSSADLEQRLRILMDQSGQRAGLAASLEDGPTRQTLSLLVLTPKGKEEAVRHYGGPPANAPKWATNIALDFLRRSLDRGL